MPEEPIENEPTEVDPDDLTAGDEIVCPECGEDFTHKGAQAKLLRGLHRRREHGIQGRGEKKAKRTARAPRPHAERQPSAARGHRPASRRDLIDGTRELYETFGLLAMMKGDELTARMIIGEKRWAEVMDAEPTDDGIAGAAAKAWGKLAQHNQTVESALSKTLTGGDWAEVIGAHMPLVFLAVQRKPERVTNLVGGFRGRLANAAIRRRAAKKQGAPRPTPWAQGRPGGPPVPPPASDATPTYQGYSGPRVVPDPK